jgi:Protein of unknown function (DUF2953).
LFFIIALLSAAAIILLLVIFRLKAVTRLENRNIRITVSFLFFRIKKEYVFKREKGELFVLYQLSRKGEKRVISFSDIFRKKEKVAGITVADTYKMIAPHYHRKNNAFYYLNRKVHFDTNIKIALGVGDAYVTALLCGLVIAIGGSLCAVYSQNTKRFKISVKPEFSRQLFSVHADCIIAITPANIILGYIIYKIRTRGKKHASDRKYHADRNGEYQRNC